MQDLISKTWQIIRFFNHHDQMIGFVKIVYHN
ncbi:hypothetical protein E9M_06530 [Moraxella catarrhalis 46P47B1]|nr:hypothetical protein E9G_05602 [Moraxella catarrhalis 7169]EGE11729.1 hypothetical protein E9M_06530 [Moraxella catarrhalis 46P47B1]EGE14295.1 hypothetical protein E9O_07498 [Moraxella catarrhalis 12P80B1]EGE20558.1 hypothetical protein E9U_04008 [Moraxella catarrhalis BC8]EGE21223.1 hypothetical protein E9S_05782 [Moraxella catarrhalis BC7]EGE26967.1 hypothetical protein EA1_03945 [Moraxella catarrhalis O35E]